MLDVLYEAIQFDVEIDDVTTKMVPACFLRRWFTCLTRLCGHAWLASAMVSACARDRVRIVTSCA